MLINEPNIEEMAPQARPPYLISCAAYETVDSFQCILNNRMSIMSCITYTNIILYAAFVLDPLSATK